MKAPIGTLVLVTMVLAAVNPASANEIDYAKGNGQWIGFETWIDPELGIDPDLIEIEGIDINGILRVQGGPGGVTVSNCHATLAVCAMATSHASYERVDNKPNVYSHMASGHGSSQNALYGVTTEITTSLSVIPYTCSQGPSSGCGATWSDVASVCKAPVKAKTVAESGPFTATAIATKTTC